MPRHRRNARSVSDRMSTPATSTRPLVIARSRSGVSEQRHRRRRLATARLPDEREHRSRCDGECDLVDDGFAGGGVLDADVGGDDPGVRERHGGLVVLVRTSVTRLIPRLSTARVIAGASDAHMFSCRPLRFSATISPQSAAGG